MKENKQVRQFLAIALLGIWGLVGYKIYKKIHPDEITFVDPVPAIAVKSVAASIDSFSLSLNYTDPFFKKSFPRNRTNSASIKLPKKKPVRIPRRPAKPIPFPAVLYKGTVRTDRSAALISINGKVRNMGVGEVLEEVTSLKIYKDSIRVKFKEENRTILKEQ